jgi:hypothetical protein
MAKRKKQIVLSEKQMMVVNALRNTNVYVVESVPSKPVIGEQMGFAVEGSIGRFEVAPATMNVLVLHGVVVRDPSTNMTRWMLNTKSPVLEQQA